MKNALTPLGMESRVWNGTPIHRRAADGYVNATAMCKAGRKLWKNYHQNDRARSYIAALSAVAGNPATEDHGLIHTIKGGRPELQGTWVHPRLAVDLARWISPAFAVWMDGWFLEVAQGQQQQAAKPRTRRSRRIEPAKDYPEPWLNWDARVELANAASQARQAEAVLRSMLRLEITSEECAAFVSLTAKELTHCVKLMRGG
jgi:hypothetical protein